MRIAASAQLIKRKRSIPVLSFFVLTNNNNVTLSMKTLYKLLITLLVLTPVIACKKDPTIDHCVADPSYFLVCEKQSQMLGEGCRDFATRKDCSLTYSYRLRTCCENNYTYSEYQANLTNRSK